MKTMALPAVATAEAERRTERSDATMLREGRLPKSIRLRRSWRRRRRRPSSAERADRGARYPGAHGGATGLY